jgi:serine/threonine protein kinase
MATVYLANDLKHDRSVALKVMHPELAATLGPERFLREIRTTAQLDHAHILPVLDSGDVAGLASLASIPLKHPDVNLLDTPEERGLSCPRPQLRSDPPPLPPLFHLVSLQ